MAVQASGISERQRPGTADSQAPPRIGCHDGTMNAHVRPSVRHPRLQLSRRALLVSLATGAVAACGAQLPGRATAAARSTVPTSTAATSTAATTTAATSTAATTTAATSTAAAGPLWISYGSSPLQYGVLRIPAGTAGKIPVVVLIHGGGWEAGYTLEGLTPHAEDLLAAGVATWNVEYRAVGDVGGGWPGTFDDVAAAVDALAGPVQEAADNRLDLDRVQVVGHSAGGHLAAWLAGRPQMPAGSPGHGPVVAVTAVVALAAVLDLEYFADHTATPNVPNLMGGSPTDVPSRYELGSPIRKLPVGIPVTCIHGDADETVPVTQSRRYVSAALEAGDPATLHELAGVDHNAVVDVNGQGWSLTRTAVLANL